MIFNYYPADIKQSAPLGSITLDKFISVIKNPKEETRHIFEQIRIAQELGDMKLKMELKSKLYYFTPCVFVVGNRKYDNIKNFTGLLALDFDKINDCEEFKEYLFGTYTYIIAGWISPSQHGVRALVSIPVCKSVGEFKEYYNAIELVFNQYKGFDKAVKNCILPMFLSYDENILYRSDYTTFTKRVIHVVQPVVKQYIITDKTKLVEAIVKSSLSKITDAGHLILRATAFALGGYVGAGYLNQETAESIICNNIDSNHYLSMKSSVYKKTAVSMIKKGINTPLYLK